MTNWFMLVLVALMACGGEGDHEGRPMAYWVAEMTNPDSARRHRAVEAFAHDASHSPDAARALMANALIAALMLFAMRWIAAGRYGRAAAAIALGASIKIFPFAALGMAVMRRDRWRLAVFLALSAASLLALPLTVVPLRDLIEQYRSWRMVQITDAKDIEFGMSFMRAFCEFWEISLPNWAFQIAGTLLALVPLLRRNQWDNEPFGCASAARC